MVHEKSNFGPRPLEGLIAGALGGMAASFAMDGFQRLWSKVVPMSDSGEPSTVKVARKMSKAAGAALARDKKAAAGQLVHYAFGTALGGAYGLLVEYRPNFATGAGALFDLGSALLFDEVAAPAANLDKSPTKAPAASHVYSAASHLVYGIITEETGRAARAAIAG